MAFKNHQCTYMELEVIFSLLALQTCLRPRSGGWSGGGHVVGLALPDVSAGGQRPAAEAPGGQREVVLVRGHQVLRLLHAHAPDYGLGGVRGRGRILAHCAKASADCHSGPIASAADRKQSAGSGKVESAEGASLEIACLLGPSPPATPPRESTPEKQASKPGNGGSDSACRGE